MLMGRHSMERAMLCVSIWGKAFDPPWSPLTARAWYLGRALLLVLPWCLLLSRPLASTVNDKLELRECLEHGRIAKVSLSAQDSGGGSGQQAEGHTAELCHT